MKISNLVYELEKLYPKYFAEEWDNIGLLVGDRDTKITKVLTALEITSDVIEEALELNCNLIIVHHPIIFKPITSLKEDLNHNNLLSSLIKNDIAVYAMHTNVDNAPFGLSDWLASILKMERINILDQKGSETIEGKTWNYGTGRTGIIKPTTLEDLGNHVKVIFGLENIRIIGERTKTITKVAIVGGSGGDLFKIAQRKKCDVLITGDISYHQAIDALNQNITLIDAGHVIEIIFNDVIAEIINNFEDKLAIASDIDVDPFITI